MNRANTPPDKIERRIIKVMIVIGLLSLINFFYWFTNNRLIEYEILFWLLVTSMLFDSFKIVYMWYHYWDISAPEKPREYPKLSVDVLTTYFPGEPYDMIKNTLLAIQRVSYPHTTYLCDEANDEYLKNFCKENNIIHVTRTNRINAKAGNINNALKQATGDLCFILDPDHVPMESVLDELVPYFVDEKIGFVQHVQAYYNIDESLVAKGAAEQTFHFYGPVMMGMNSYGTVNAIGANCLFRRKALDSIGGHAPGLSEDMHTAMQLHAKGWKSVYVPEVLTKGLVPETLTSYYKQQLKWSRGTLELLVTEFPKLFRKFTLRQKFHYGILPLYYLSGIIYLINFLIPIIALFTASLPWKGDMEMFALLFSPILATIVGLRVYIQKWLIHRSERGMHFIGGLLQASTWWIFIIGFIYTVIRKKVPYLPTPKEDKGNTDWKILIPNIAIGLVSIIAIIYGLSIDFNPFSIFMSCFAMMNVFFMAFTLIFAYQKPKKVEFTYDYKEIKNRLLRKAETFINIVLRKAALPLIMAILAYSIYIQSYNEFFKWKDVQLPRPGKNIISFVGIFDPANDNGLSSFQNVKTTAQNSNINFSIISLYLTWELQADDKLIDAFIDSVYAKNSVPLIAWEPWLTSNNTDSIAKKHVFDMITEGYFDRYILNISEKFKSFQKPIFLRFAHEFDNSFYPWYVDKNESLKFKSAWIHVYEIFKRNNAQNVIWVWNPWSPDAVETFYPGQEYVDWIGLDILNYNKYSKEGKTVSFDSLYVPFRKKIMNLPETPVMLAELGSLGNSKEKGEWLQNAMKSIENKYHEVKSVIFFSSKFDNNHPYGIESDVNLDWSLPEKTDLADMIKIKHAPDYIFTNIPDIKLADEIGVSKSPMPDELKNTIGINLKKGHDWRKDYHVLSRKNLISDFTKIKDLGVNTVKYQGNSIYNYNVLNISKDFGLKISYGFWIPSEINFINDSIETQRLKRQILDEVEKNKDKANITSWAIQNDIQYNQKDHFNKPELLYQNSAFIIWLKDLITEIKKIDPGKPVIVDLEVNPQSIYFAKVLKSNIPEIDALGIIVKNSEYLETLTEYLTQSNINFVYSDIPVNEIIEHKIIAKNKALFASAYQDQFESDKLSFYGITDRKGRFKTDYYNLKNALENPNAPVRSLKTKILKPATLIYEGQKHWYLAMYYDEKEGWKEADEVEGLTFEWSVIRCDASGNYVSIKDMGNAPYIHLKIPKSYDYYRLLLTTIKDGEVSISITTLNTPLEPKSENFD